MGVKRRVLAVLVAVGLAPGTFVRTTPDPPDYTAPVRVEQLAVERVRTGPLTLEGAWQLSSENDHFGGYSALVLREPDMFLAASDAGRLMHLPRPDMSEASPILGEFLTTEHADKFDLDIESLAIDPQTGRVWAGLEWVQQIIRFDAGLERRAAIAPEAMRNWGSNSGAEAMVRLSDGRFVVIEERAREEGLHRALLFPRDPTSRVRPTRFLFAARPGFRPADAALLPDGRIAVLLRAVVLGLAPRFPAMLVIADPADIRSDEILSSIMLARIEEPLPSDNYEGLAVIDMDAGNWDFWLISDDNFARYQRTLLLKLRWDRRIDRTRKKAREKPARP